MIGYSYDNNILYMCCLIEFIGRKQLTKRSTVVNKIGYNGLKHVYEFASILHSDNIEAVADEYIKRYRIRKSTYDNVGRCKYKIPFYGDIAYVYMSLIASQKGDIVTNLMSIYNSWLAEKINDYNSVIYFKSPEYLHIAYEDGELPD